MKPYLSNSKPTPLPHTLTKPKQHQHAHSAQDHETAEETDASVNADAHEHGSGEQDCCKCEQASRQTISREDAGSVSRVDVGNVKEHTLSHEICSEDCQSEADAVAIVSDLALIDIGLTYVGTIQCIEERAVQAASYVSECPMPSQVEYCLPNMKRPAQMTGLANNPGSRWFSSSPKVPFIMRGKHRYFR